MEWLRVEPPGAQRYFWKVFLISREEGNMAGTVASESEVEAPATGSGKWLETALSFLARYREVSIAAVAILLVTYIQSRNSVFLSSAEMSVVLRDTARI